MNLRWWHIGVLALLFFVPGLGLAGLFDWDEVNFAEAAREMLVSGQYGHVQIDFKPFWEKPPLFFWLQALCMKAFGVGEFAARLPNAFAGAFTLMLLHHRGSKLGGNRLGLLWACVFVGSMLPQFYFRSGIIDPWFNLILFLAIDRAIVYFIAYRPTKLLASAFFLGLAVLTKGPVAVAIFGAVLVVWAGFNWKIFRLKISHWLGFAAITMVVGFSWFAIEVLEGRSDVLLKYIDYHRRLIGEGEAGHAQPFFYHFVVLLVGCFPMSVVFIESFFGNTQSKQNRIYLLWMQVMFWVVLIGFSVVKTKIIHYSSLCYLPMSFVVATTLDQRWSNEQGFSHVTQWLLALLGVLWGTAIGAVALFEIWRPLVLRSFALPPDTVALLNNTSPMAYGAVVLGIIMAVGAVLGSVLLQRHVRNALIILFGTTALVTWGTSLVLMPKVYEQVQGSLRKFYQDQATNGVVVQPLAFHSYAHLFYGRRTFDESSEFADLQYSITGNVNRPVLFLIRHSDLENHLRWFPGLKEIGKVGDKVLLQRTDAIYRFGNSGK